MTDLTVRDGVHPVIASRESPFLLERPMSDTRPSCSRLAVAEGAEGLRIVIPGRRRLGTLFLVFFAVWLVIWNALGIAFALRLLPADLEVVRGWRTWSALILSDAIVLPIFLWYLAGREIVLLDDRSLTIRREVLGIGRSRTYARGRI